MSSDCMRIVSFCARCASVWIGCDPIASFCLYQQLVLSIVVHPRCALSDSKSFLYLGRGLSMPVRLDPASLPEVGAIQRRSSCGLGVPHRSFSGLSRDRPYSIMMDCRCLHMEVHRNLTLVTNCRRLTSRNVSHDYVHWVAPSSHSS
jgi:hypothetical protein